MSAGSEALRAEKPTSTRLFLAVVASSVFVTVLTATMINVLIPLMRAEFGASSAQVGWVVTGYSLAYAIGVPLYGRISVLFLSTFGAGASPVMVSMGMLGLGIGFAFIQAPATNAATNALPESEVGAGMGIFAGAFFLGAGTGPAIIGAFLAAREEAGSGAINPLYTLDAAPSSDAFLAMVPALIIALIAAFGLRSNIKGNEQSGKEKAR